MDLNLQQWEISMKKRRNIKFHQKIKGPLNNILSVGTWPSQEWRLPPKQQGEGSNPSVSATTLSPIFHR